MNEFRLGIDIGSTTLKAVVTHNDSSDIVFSCYTRHNLDINHTLASVLNDLEQQTGNVPFAICITDSIGMGVAEKLDIPLMQEVVAASLFVRAFRPDTATMIDIGGEDGMMAFFKDSNPVDLRMNGNCAGGTGAFIDQMAWLLDTDTSGLDVLARSADSIYPIASRCGVFSKTDIQNLMARNVCKEDIAASIFHAVSVQTVTTLARGKKVQPPVLMCGAPLTYLPSLRKAFADYLEMCEEDFIVPENSQLIPAWGCALCRKGKRTSLSELQEVVNSLDYRNFVRTSDLPPIFSSGDEYDEWRRRVRLPCHGLRPEVADYFVRDAGTHRLRHRPAAMPWMSEPVHGDPVPFRQQQCILFGQQVLKGIFQQRERCPARSERIRPQTSPAVRPPRRSVAAVDDTGHSTLPQHIRGLSLLAHFADRKQHRRGSVR